MKQIEWLDNYFRSFTLRLAGVFSALLLYLALFFISFPSRGAESAAFSILPVILAAYCFGLRAGLLAGLFALPLNTLLINLAGNHDLSTFLIRSGPGAIVVIIVGLTVGLLHDLREHLKQELDERHKVEQTLRISEARHKAILEALPDLMFQLNREGRIVEFKAQNSEDLCLPPDKMVGTKVTDMGWPEFGQRVVHFIHETLTTGAVQAFEYEWPMPHGVQAYEARMVVAGTDEVVAIVHNITQRKAAEKALITSAEQYRALFEQTNDAVFLIAFDGAFLAVNQRAADMFGYSRDELKGMSVGDLVSSREFPPLPIGCDRTCLRAFCAVNHMELSFCLRTDHALLDPEVVSFAHHFLWFLDCLTISVQKPRRTTALLPEHEIQRLADGRGGGGEVIVILEGVKTN